jgi:hypothetical protein
MRRLVVLAAAILGLALVATPPVLADPPDVFTDINKDVTITFPVSENPCTGVPGSTTITFNEVFHITDQGTSEGLSIYHVAGTLTGTFEFVPNDPTEPSFSGHFTSTTSVQSTPAGLGFVATFTSTSVAVGSDGSLLRFHVTSQFTRLPSGEVVVDFFNVTCG